MIASTSLNMYDECLTVTFKNSAHKSNIHKLLCSSLINLLKKDLINIPMVYALYSAYNIIITKLLNFSKNYDNLGMQHSMLIIN